MWTSIDCKELPCHEETVKVLKYAREKVSCAHRYAREDWSREKNLRVYGEDYSEEGMGHNLGILVCGTGEVQRPLNQLCHLLDHQFLNSIMGAIVPTTEAIAQYGFKTIEASGAKKIQFVQIQEGDHLWAQYIQGKLSTLTKSYRFNSLHRHYNPSLSNEENRSLYGKCFHVHGHEYKIEVTLVGPIDNKTFLICPRQWMDSLVNRLIIQPFDKNFLNDFMDNASGEIIIQKIYDILRPSLPKRFQLRLCLRETRKNSFFLKDMTQ